MTCPNCGGEYSDATPTCPHCGWDVEALPGGTVLGERYEIVDLLGAGGLGRVYRARDLTLEEAVALKVLHPEATRSPELTKRFFTEIKLARKVRHRNVCAIHEYGEHQGLRFLAMELVDGVDLSRTLRERGPLPPREAFEAAVQVAKGLEAIHEAGVIHRDLKTPNIMRDSQGVVRLLDFGIAKRTAPHGTLAVTADQKVVGTPEYMSPEQIRGEEVGPRSDLYALGVVIYELFTGVVPFRAPTPLATLLKQITDPPPLEGYEAARIPRALVPVLRRALAKDPKDRYGSATELLDALRAARVATFPEAVVTPAALPPFEPPSTALEALRTSVLRKPDLTPPPATTPRPPSTPATDPAGAPSSAREAAAESALDSGRTYVELRPVRATTPAASYDPSAPPSSTVEVPALAPPPPSASLSRWPQWAWFVAGAALVAGVVVVGQRWGRQGADTGPVAEATPVSSPPTGRATPEPRPSGRDASPSAASRISPVPPDVTPLPATPTPAGPAITEPDEPFVAASPEPEPPIATPTPWRRRPRATPTPPPTPEPTPEPTPTPLGALALSARPWAQVEVDDQALGSTPVDGLTLEPGFHNVRFIHPDYWPVTRQVRIEAGQKDRLEIDLGWEAVKRGGGTPHRIPMDDPPSDAFFERGERLLGEGLYREAKVMLMPVVRRLQEQRGHRKELACAAFYLGMAYLELGDTARARESFTTALQSDASLQPPAAAFSAKVMTFFNRVRQDLGKK